MKANYRAILVAVLPFLGVVFLSLMVVRFALIKITEMRAKIAAERKSQVVLRQKLDLLDGQGEEILDSSSVSLSVLPSSNPALIVLSQLRRLAGRDDVNFISVKVGQEDEFANGIKSIVLSLEVEGMRAALFSFLKSIRAMAPISSVESVKMSGISDIVQAKVVVKSFWSPFPRKLPPFDSPVSDLTMSERDLLHKIDSLTKPVFVEIPPAETNKREDPFGVN